MVHYLIEPTELAYLADIGGLSGHNGLRNLSGGYVNAVSQAMAGQRHQNIKVIPEFVGRTGFNRLPGSPLVLGATLNQYNGLQLRGRAPFVLSGNLASLHSRLESF